MNNHKLNILFLVQRKKVNRKGYTALRCRITYKKRRKDFSIGIFVNPKFWDSKKQKLLDKTDNSNIVNSQMSLISQKINEVFLLLQLKHKDFDVDDIYNQYKGNNVRVEKTILDLYRLHNEQTKKLIGVDFNEISWSRYVENMRKVERFIKDKYKKNDIRLDKLDLKFIKDLEYYFKTELNLSQATINRSLQRVKKIIQFGIDENYLDKNPFALYKATKYKLKVVFLNQEELNLLQSYNFKQPTLQKVKDLFVFCCYTGFAYQEMSTLNQNHIKLDSKGNKWIEINRKKTNSKVIIPLLPFAEDILEKYKWELPKISNQKFNSYLKEISGVLGFDKKITHHVARKTFATTVLLNNGVSMEVVSELLGHSRLQVTQAHYAKIIRSRIIKEIKILKRL